MRSLKERNIQNRKERGAQPWFLNNYSLFKILSHCPFKILQDNLQFQSPLRKLFPFSFQCSYFIHVFPISPDGEKCVQCIQKNYGEFLFDLQDDISAVKIKICLLMADFDKVSIPVYTFNNGNIVQVMCMNIEQWDVQEEMMTQGHNISDQHSASPAGQFILILKVGHLSPVHIFTADPFGKLIGDGVW